MKNRKPQPNILGKEHLDCLCALQEPLRCHAKNVLEEGEAGGPEIRQDPESWNEVVTFGDIEKKLDLRESIYHPPTEN